MFVNLKIVNFKHVSTVRYKFHCIQVVVILNFCTGMLG